MTYIVRFVCLALRGHLSFALPRTSELSLDKHRARQNPAFCGHDCPGHSVPLKALSPARILTNSLFGNDGFHHDYFARHLVHDEPAQAVAQ